MIEIIDKDIVEKFVHSRGKGGQNVNKVATCVYLKHIPTGISVKCDVYRSQAMNRELAKLLLAQKIRKEEEDILNRNISEEQKIKRQNRKRPYALKEKILKDKKMNSEKKKIRKISKNDLSSS